MVQAWDFVDASVLWQSRQSQNAFLNKRVDQIDFGRRCTPRIRQACYHFEDWVFDPETGKETCVTCPVVTVADMVKLNEAEWLRIPNLGLRSLNAMRVVLAEHGLTFGMRGAR